MQTATIHTVISEQETDLPSTATVLKAPFYLSNPEVHWSPVTRVGFRFVFSYLALYWLAIFTGTFWGKLVAWTGVHVFGLSQNLKPVMTGSGDSTYEYVLTFCVLVFGLLATAIWSLLDRRRTNYDRLQLWFRSALRMLLGATIAGYGAVKLIQTQMPPPTPSGLLETYGQSSPMHLLWTFMGASRGYNAFTGGVEMLAAVLLFIPGLTALGALLTMTAMTNVFMLNMCYDVPVKLFSFHLLFMAAVLAAPDARRLAQFFLFGRTARLRKNPPLFKRLWVKRTMLVLQLVFCVAVTVGPLYVAHKAQQSFSDFAKSPTFGSWSVDQYAMDGKSISSGANNRWQTLVWERPMVLKIGMDGSWQRFLVNQDVSKRTFEIRSLDDDKWTTGFSYQNPQPDSMTITGPFDGHRIDVHLRRLPQPSSFPLTSRGFHWINEYPYNE
ncbi:MAG: hypothetical protein WA655_24730 [Candidatus Korobacteraceae bacterium]